MPWCDLGTGVGAEHLDNQGDYKSNEGDGKTGERNKRDRY